MEPLNANDAQRYLEFKEWTPFEAALLLAGCKPLPRGHIPEPNGNTPAFNLIQAIQYCGPSKNLETPHPPETWKLWYSEHLAGRDFPEFSQQVMHALERNMNSEVIRAVMQPALTKAAEEIPELAEPPREEIDKEAVAVIIDRGLVMKKAALIKKHQGQWPTLERDLRDASENGLSKMAKNPRHGFWFEVDALKWAEQQGKLLLNSANAAPKTQFPSTIHRVKG